MLALTENPLLYREWRVATRPLKFWSVFLAVFGFLGLILLYLYLLMIYDTRPYRIRDEKWMYETFTVIVLGAQFFIAFYVTLGLTMDAIPAEMQRNSHDFLVTLPVSAIDKAVGLALGPSILPFILLVALAVPGVISWMIAGLPLGILAWLYLIILTGFVAYSFLGATVGQALGRLRGSWILVLIYLILSGAPASAMAGREFRALPFITPFPFSTLIRSVAEITEPSGAYHFFSVQVPWQLCPLVFYVFLAGLAVFASCWKLQRSTSRPMPRAASLGFFAVFLVLLVGFMADSLRSDARHGYPGMEACFCLVMCFFFVLVWSMATSAPLAGMMVWGSHKPNWPRRIITESFSDLRTPPFVAAGCMWAMAVLALTAASVLYWSAWPDSGLLLAAAVVLVFLLAYISLYMFGRLLSDRGGVLCGIIFLLVALTGPYCFSEVDGLEYLTQATPQGVMSIVDRWATKDWAGPSLAFGLAELALFGGLFAWRLHTLRARSPAARKPAPQP